MHSRVLIRIPVIFPAVLCIIVMSGGCVHKTVSIQTDPAVQADVFIDGKYRGRTPYCEEFVYYGTREVMLRYPDGSVAVKDISLARPWFEYFPLDFISELCIPAVINSRFSFVISPPEQKKVDFKEIEKRASEFKTGCHELIKPEYDE